MTVLRLHDSPPAPGLRHAALAALARAVGSACAAADTGRRVTDDVHAVQHVSADGRLVPNGNLWPERADLVVRPSSAEAAEEIVIGAGDETVTLAVAWEGTESAALMETGRVLARIERDPYGRPYLADTGPLAQRLGPPLSSRRPAAARQSAGPIVIVGDATHLRHVYPAIPAMIGDAADALAASPRLAIVPPQEGTDWVAALDGAAGLVLPGGADLRQVEGQVAAAQAALARDLPTLGLCLGMQSMTVAVARTRLDAPQATLEELAPGAADLVFRRLRTGEGTPRHRLGEEEVRLPGATPLARLAGATVWRERMNHRYGLAQPWRERLARDAGLCIAASPTDDVVDLVAVPDRSFFVGAQGHPELTSHPQAPHPLALAFMRCVVAAA